ncbi:MAG: hypothetical protein JRG80_05125 [Deltaproteobacteria bacterium]|nr:hypothetical protein [Deltaproteobacteria bacterium]
MLAIERTVSQSIVDCILPNLAKPRAPLTPPSLPTWRTHPSGDDGSVGSQGAARKETIVVSLTGQLKLAKPAENNKVEAIAFNSV